MVVAFATMAAAAPAARPNVILVMSDDQGYGDLSVHGHPVLKTPNLDRLHGESVRLTDFHVAPMCTPTRAQLMTGTDAMRNGAMNVSSGRAMLRREFPTLAELLGTAGYRTGIFGKWHLGDNYPYRPQDRGFQESLWFPSSHISSAPDFFNNDYFDDTFMRNGRREQVPGYCTDAFFREAMTWMKGQADRGERFFCYLPLNAPHGPFFVPDHYREPYRKHPHNIASFFAMIANLDENVGRLDAFLRETGLRENTILIFLTDNGTATGDTVFNAGMRGKKVGLYEGGHRVPFFVRWPERLGAPRDIAELTQVQDVLPTLLDFCGVARPAKLALDGTSLAPFLRGETKALPERMLVTQFTRLNNSVPARGDALVLWKRWRLVQDKELYDLAADPAQKSNVIAEHPEIVARMREHYARWWAGVEPRMNEFSPVHIGAEQENPTLLSPCEWRDVFLDQQLQVRTAKKNGTWTLFVERDGEYEFALRRWPVEIDAPLTAGRPADKVHDGKVREGLAFPIASAVAEIGGTRLEKTVSADDKAATFTLKLSRGGIDLRTAFRDAEGKEIAGAYYVYVRRK